jgi:ATP-dependent exoDNAse (exonuclease V) alpha subunit
VPAPAGTAEQITAEVLRQAVDLSPPLLTPRFSELERADGSSIYRPRTYPTYTTTAILRAEDRLLAAARTPVIPAASREGFAKTARRFAKRARRSGHGLDPGQQLLAQEFACSDRLLLAGIGPAGSGKTEAMKLVAAAVTAAGGRLVALAPSARAAQVLAGKLDGHAHTLHAWLERRERPEITRRPVPPGYELRPGDVVVVDEAGMAGTLMLERVLKDAEQAGAVVRLLGDPAQLAAVEAGGVLRLVAREEGAVRLEQLHRFSTPGEGEASLLLRDGPPEDAFTWYRTRGRIVGGELQALLEEVFTAWSRDTAAGRTSLMCAPEAATVTALNARAQKARIAQGQVRPARTARRRRVRGRDGLAVHAGDLVVTRTNNRRHLLRGGRDFIKNGDT